MGRRDYQRFVVTGQKGINQNRDLANPQTELADARNVWAPLGHIEKRPGFSGHMLPVGRWSLRSDDFANEVAIVEDVSTGLLVATVTPSIASLDAAGVGIVAGRCTSSGSTITCTAGDRVYYGVSGMLTAGRDITKTIGLFFGGTNPNNQNNKVNYKAEYWNGSAWVLLSSAWHIRVSVDDPNLEVQDSLGFPAHKTVDGVAAYHTHLFFAWPTDFATKAITATTPATTYTRYFIRFTIIGDATITAVTNGSQFWRPDNIAGLFAVDPNSPQDPGTGYFLGVRFAGIGDLQFSSTTKQAYLFGSVLYCGAGLPNLSRVSAARTLPNVPFYAVGSPTLIDIAPNSEPPTFAVVPQFDEAFVAYGNTVSRVVADPATAPAAATVESGDFAVGVNAPYDKLTIDLLTDIPKAKYIVFYKGRLWCAGMEDQPYSVLWSAATPYHKVFTRLANEPLMEDDNSPITGMIGFDEHVVVTKNDSIWRMIPVGENAITGVDTFSPIRVVAGTGCVSNASIQKIRGNLFMLAEEGIVMFDGTANIQKISQRIDSYVRRINVNRRPWAVGVNWRKHSCYLLAVSVDSSAENNMVFVYDYKNDAWWVWDNIHAAAWLDMESSSDDEQLYFVDVYGRYFELEAARHDYGTPISATFTSQRLGRELDMRFTVREVEIEGTSSLETMDVGIQMNDNTNGLSTGAMSFEDAADVEYSASVNTTSTYAQEGRRSRRMAFRATGDWAQVVVTHDEKNLEAEISNVFVKYQPVGPR